jgi:hypothetical protein
LWAKLVDSAARVAAAALPEALAEQAKLKMPPHSTFEVCARGAGAKSFLGRLAAGLLSKGQRRRAQA